MGGHIRAKRLGINLFQKEVAKIIGTSEESINHWEMKTTETVVKYYPKIMGVLGFCPVHYIKSFGELLFLHRTHRGGLSHRKLEKYYKSIQQLFLDGKVERSGLRIKEHACKQTTG